MENQRKETRHTFIYHVEIVLNEKVIEGEIIDWSHHGAQICMLEELNKDYTKILLQVERHKGEVVTKVENSEPLMIWSRNGLIKWKQYTRGVSWFGVEFNPSLDENPHGMAFPIDHRGEYLTPQDKCYILLIK